MKPLSENGPMAKGIKVLLILIIACCWNVDPLPEMLELEIFPDTNFSMQLTAILIVDLGLCWGM
jgi:hypothetical protein